MKALWMVRAGRGGTFLSYFRDKSCVAIGFGEHAGIIDDRITKEQLVARYSESMPAAKEGSVAVAASQLLRFPREIAPGDGVCTYDAEQGHRIRENTYCPRGEPTRERRAGAASRGGSEVRPEEGLMQRLHLP